jgi:hypothetical protein
VPIPAKQRCGSLSPASSHTVQTLIQSGKLGLAVASVPITAHHTPRPSRLHQGMLHFISQQALILLRTYVAYEPVEMFGALAAPFLLIGTILLIRLLLRFAEQGWQLPGNVQFLSSAQSRWRLACCCSSLASSPTACAKPAGCWKRSYTASDVKRHLSFTTFSMLPLRFLYIWCRGT